MFQTKPPGGTRFCASVHRREKAGRAEARPSRQPAAADARRARGVLGAASESAFLGRDAAFALAVAFLGALALAPLPGASASAALACSSVIAVGSTSFGAFAF